MNWLKALRIGRAVVKLLDKEGIKVKGKKVGEIVDVIETVAKTTDRLIDLKK